LASLKLRDRDAIITREGLIFRVFGYDHPEGTYICDAEYAPAQIFKSYNPKAPRGSESSIFYKFYEDEGLKLLQKQYPQYMLFNEMLQRKIVGVRHSDVADVRKPDARLASLMEGKPKDELVSATQNVLDHVTRLSGLPRTSFGVFGSMLHGFHHPKFSDIDLTVYGHRNVDKLRLTLQDLYETENSAFRNEFETIQSVEGKNWKFRNFSPEEFVRHQQRKLIYALLSDAKNGRVIKTEFEPVKDWSEISNEYSPDTRIAQRGWTKMLARVTADEGAPFIPSHYEIEVLEVLQGAKEAAEAKRIVSYVEEFRMQAFKDEIVHVEGNLEELVNAQSSFIQVALTYCPRYYEQVLKSRDRS